MALILEHRANFGQRTQEFVIVPHHSLDVVGVAHKLHTHFRQAVQHFRSDKQSEELRRDVADGQPYVRGFAVQHRFGGVE